MKKILIFMVILFVASSAEAANRYWVGTETDDWDAIAGTKWAATSGGVGGEPVPTSADDVFFDLNSGGIDQIDGVCRSLNTTGYAPPDDSVFGSIADAGEKINIGDASGGSLTINDSLSWPIEEINFVSNTTGNTITTNGKNLNSTDFNFNGTGGVWTLQDDLRVHEIDLNRGSLDLNDKDVITRLFSASGSNVRSVSLGSGTMTLSDGSVGTTTVWNTSVTTNLTLNEETSTIKLTGLGSSSRILVFSGGGETFYNFWNDLNSGQARISGSNTFNDIEISAGRTQQFTAGTTTTVSSFTAVGTSGRRITITSPTAASHTISDSSGTNDVEYCTISYSTAQGGATWNSPYLDGNVNDGNNSGWDFGSAIKKFMGVNNASIKKVNGVAFASVKTLNGIEN